MLGAYSNLPLIEIWVSWRGLQFNNNKDRTQMRDLECHSVSARILHTRANNLFCFDISVRKHLSLGHSSGMCGNQRKRQPLLKVSI